MMQGISPELNLLPSHSVELLIRQEVGDPLLLRTLVESGVEEGVFRVVAPTIQGRTYLFDDVQSVDVQYNVKIEGQTKIVSLPCRLRDKYRVEEFSLVELEIAGEPSLIQRRGAFRVTLCEVFEYLRGEEPAALVTRDLSLSGMMACTEQRLGEGEKITILWRKAGSFEIAGKVLSCRYLDDEQRYEIRVVFDPLSEKNAQTVVSYLFKKQSEMLQNDQELMEKLWRSAERKHTDSPEAQYTSVFGLIALVLLVVSLVFYMQAKPPAKYVLDYFFSYERSIEWDTTELSISLVIAFVSVLFSLISIGAKYYYYRLGKYRFTFSPFLVLILSSLFFAQLLYLALINIGLPA